MFDSRRPLPIPALPSLVPPTAMDTDTLLQSGDQAAAATTSITAVAATSSLIVASAAADAILPEKTDTPPTVPKRQRRPSVRLGEIGGRSSSGMSHDSYVRRSKPQHIHPLWGTNLDPSSSKSTVKARSITNLVNGNRKDHHPQDDVFDFEVRKAKSKRGGTSRVRSTWITSSSKPDEVESLRLESTVNSAENEPVDLWNRQGRLGQFSGHRARVSNSRDNNSNELDFNPRDSDSKETNEAITSWLIDLGLSRYAPVFEIHEVDAEILPMLTLEDLKDMGISAVASRRKLYAAIQKLRQGLP